MIDKAPQSPKSYLYTCLIDSHLGEQASLIISYLISHGRSTAQQLSSYTKIPIFNVKQSLVSLVQLNIVTYHQQQNGATSKEEETKSQGASKKPKSIIHYNFNEQGVLKLLYSGDIIHQVNSFYEQQQQQNQNQNNENATEMMSMIIQNFLQYGYLTLNDYKASLGSSSSATTTTPDLDAAFIKLVQDKWLIPITKFHFQNKFDLYNDIFKSKLITFNKENKNLSESKKLAEVKQLTNEAFDKLVKVNLNDMKLTTVKNGDLVFASDIPLTFNLNRYLQRKRSIALKDFCKHSLGPLSAELYWIILNKFEKISINCIDDELEMLKFSNDIMITSTGLDPDQVKLIKEHQINQNIKLTTFNATDIYRECVNNKEINFKNSIIKPQHNNSDQDDSGPARKKIKLEIPDDFDAVAAAAGAHDNDMDHDMDQDQDEVSLIMQHLKILATNGFLRESSPGKFYISIDETTKLLKQNTISQLIKAIFGPNCLRIINCCKKQKLIDEKMFQNILLMKDATIRSNLNKLVMYNFLELQEIPKTNDRLAIRTVYAFKFNQDHVVQRTLNSLYYNLAEILANIESIHLENKILLDKCNRDDVKGKEFEVLIENELIKLKEIFQAESNDLKKFIRISSLIQTLEL